MVRKVNDNKVNFVNAASHKLLISSACNVEAVFRSSRHLRNRYRWQGGGNEEIVDDNQASQGEGDKHIWARVGAIIADCQRIFIALLSEI